MADWATASDTAARVTAGEITAYRLVETHLANISEHDRTLRAFLAVDGAGARDAASEIERRRTAGEPLGKLAGVAVAVKDNLVTHGLVTTAGSRILADWVPPYDATVVERLRAAGAIIVGKTNLDEFGMGSSTENSAFHKTKNPWDVTRVPGGSSGGSAAAVAAGMAAIALGTDTGGSIRQPAALSGVVGLKPTYGRVSRWGVVAFASSLDQVGPFARTVRDAALVLEVIAGHDPRDATSLDVPVEPYSELLEGDIAGLRIGLPREYFAHPIESDIRAALERTVGALRARGAVVSEISLPHTSLALAAYYVIAPAEASSNLARYDGIRFGKPAPGPHRDLLDLYCRTRGNGFGPEVKRRIMLGTYALRSGYYDAYYKKAQQLRTLIAHDFARAFQHIDVVLTPTTPTTAFAFGAKATPLDMYLGDVFTLACSLAGLPGLSIPCGFSSTRLPIGVQLIGRALDEVTVLRIGAAIETAAAITDRHPEPAR